jgi:hypothetical protein
LIEWIVDIHNNVNISLNKPTISIDDFYAFYNNKYNLDVQKNTCKITCDIPKNKKFKHKEHTNTNTNFAIILIFGVIIALSLYMFRQIQLENNLI